MKRFLHCLIFIQFVMILSGDIFANSNFSVNNLNYYQAVVLGNVEVLKDKFSLKLKPSRSWGYSFDSQASDYLLVRADEKIIDSLMQKQKLGVTNYLFMLTRNQLGEWEYLDTFYVKSELGRDYLYPLELKQIYNYELITLAELFEKMRRNGQVVKRSSQSSYEFVNSLSEVSFYSHDEKFKPSQRAIASVSYEIEGGNGKLNNSIPYYWYLFLMFFLVFFSKIFLPSSR